MLPRMIGVTGPAGAGKDTVADFIVGQMPKYRKVAFADPIKAMLKAGLGMTDTQLNGVSKGRLDPRYNQSPRAAMQTLGTEWGREMIHGDVWIHALASRVGSDMVVISDVRFLNEATYIRDRGGLIIHIEGRGGLDSGHQSELGFETQPEAGDVVVVNDGGLSTLYGRVYDAVIAPLAR